MPEVRLELEAAEAESLGRGAPLTLAWHPADAVVFPEESSDADSSPVVTSEAETTTV